MREKKFGVVWKKMRREDRGWSYITTDDHHLVVIIEQQAGSVFPSPSPSIALQQFMLRNTLRSCFPFSSTS